MPKIIFALLLLFSIKAFSQMPETDIWLMNIGMEKGKIQFSNATNITQRKGYENQPSFSADGSLLYFTSSSDTSTQTDIYTYALSTQKIKPYTISKTSEYSPTVNFTGTGLSVLMVEEDSSQRIWEYPFSGGKPSRLFAARDSIGYFAWVDANSVLAFILPYDDANPQRLALLHTNGTEKKIAQNIGRGMKVYGKSALYIKIADTLNYVSITDFSQTKQLVKAPGKSVDLAVYKNYVLMADGSTIYGAKMLLKNKEIIGLEAFVPLRNFSKDDIQKISRMAVSPDEKTIALVVEK